ncbi:MAG: flagellar export chaperone FliS [Kiloniellales bacterium]
MNDLSRAASAYAQASKAVAPVRAVVLLYDGMIRAVASARKAIEEDRLEDRYLQTRKASEIVLGLQTSLDFENGAEVANTLDAFYNTIFVRLQRINTTNSVEICEDVLAALRNVRESWAQVAEICEGERRKAKVEAQPQDALVNPGSLSVSA